jgi:hypothetical protein
MGEGLQHHYANNSHHPEFHADGVNGMTLVDLVEMLADWKAATERHADGDLAKSLDIQRDRFGLTAQLAQILENTARQFGWIRGRPCGAERTHDGRHEVCNVPLDRSDGHFGPHADGKWDGGIHEWWGPGALAWVTS